MIPLPCSLLESPGLQCSPRLLVRRIPPLLVIMSVATTASAYVEECDVQRVIMHSLLLLTFKLRVCFLSPFGKLVTRLCLLFILCPSAICFNLAEGCGGEASQLLGGREGEAARTQDDGLAYITHDSQIQLQFLGGHRVNLL